MIIVGLMTGWWYTYHSEKYELVSWDDEIPNLWEKKKCSRPPTSIILLRVPIKYQIVSKIVFRRSYTSLRKRNTWMIYNTVLQLLSQYRGSNGAPKQGQ